MNKLSVLKSFKQTLRLLRRRGQLNAQRSLIIQLGKDLKAEKDNLEIAAQRLQIAKNLGVGGVVPSSLVESIRNQKERVSDLQRQLNDFKSDSSQVDAQTQSSIEQDRLSQQQEVASMDSQIESTNQNLNALTVQLNTLRKSVLNFNDQVQIQQLQNQIKEQQIISKQLKQQKQFLIQQWNSKVGGEKAQSNALKNNSRKSEFELKQELETEKATLRDLERDFIDAKQSQSGQVKGIEQLETNYQDEKAKVQSLSDRLREAEALTGQ